MKYQVDNNKKEATFKFELTNEEWNTALERAYNKTKGRYSIPGFRKGKVPRKIIERNYGEGVFAEDAFDMIFPEVYSKALDENPSIFPVDRPKIKWEDAKGDGIKFSATVVLKPEVELGEYKGIKLKKTVHNVASKDVDLEIDKARQRAGRKVEVSDRAAKEGDFVIIDYSGSVDGVIFEGGTASKQELELGAKHFIPGFEEGVVGMKIGDSKIIATVFPQEYHSKELAGKKADFVVTLHEIKMMQLPNLDDEFAKDVSQFDTFKEYKDDVKKRLEEAAKQREDSQNEANTIERVVTNATIDVPECMIESHIDYMLEEYAARLSKQGLKIEDYFKYTNTTEDDFRKARREQAIIDVKIKLTLEEIIKKEKIEAKDKEIEEKLTPHAEAAKQDIKEYIDTMHPQRLEYIKHDICLIKAIDLIKKNVVWDDAKTATAKANAAAKESKPKATGAKSAPAKTAASKKNQA